MVRWHGYLRWRPFFGVADRHLTALDSGEALGRSERATSSPRLIDHPRAVSMGGRYIRTPNAYALAWRMLGTGGSQLVWESQENGNAIEYTREPA